MEVEEEEGGRGAITTKNPCDMVARVVTQAIGGKVRGKRHGPEESEVQITAQTNVSLERCRFELMKTEKYRIIHIFHVGSILQITFDPN